MTQRSRFLSIGFSLLVVLCFSCTTHQRPVSQSGAHRASGAGAAVATGVGIGAVDSQLVNGGPSALQEQAARAQAARSDAGGGPVAFYAVKMVETAPVSSLPSSTAEADKTQSQPGVEANELNVVEVKQNMPGNGPTAPSSRASLSVPSPAPLFSFEGNSAANNTAFFGSTVAPPDTNGAIGPNHYVQYVNLLVGVYDKTTHALVGGRFALSSFFAPLGGICAATNNGDPVVLYDKLSNRWILSQFGFTALNAPPYHMCIGISKTPDPTGPYYAFDFQLPGSEFPDYPKLGSWPDAYYMTTNQFFMGGGFDGGGAFAFDRAKMLVGDPTAGGIYFNLNLASHPEGIFGMLPSDFDGLTPPPAGAPNVFAYPTGTTFGDPADGVRLFDFNVGVPFGTGPTFIERPESTYAAPVPVAAWDLRDPGGRADIFQPPPAAGSADRLDAVASRLMHRMQYYNHAGTETLVTNITVNTSGVAPINAASYRASVRYLELQRTGGAFSVNEQGTQSPTADGRWMGSAAEDNSADIAVAYSISSTTVHPSLAYAGRVPGDPAGTLESEQTLFAGTGVQRGTVNRWGDYSALQLDPTDFCTFWYTNEYYTTTNATFNWQTRIGAFKFPTCVSPAMGTLVGNVTYCQSGNPIKGAVLSVSDGHGGATIANGTYSINLPPGTYAVTATDPFANCGPSSSQTVTITDGGTATANFCLTGTPLINFIGSSFDDSPGNGNGVINRNECFKVNTVLENDGCFPETGISAVLSTSTPGVVVDQALSAYPNLAINASGGNQTPYAAHTTPSFVCGTPIAFTLTETGSLGGSRLFNFSFPTCAGPAQPFSGTLTNTDAVATNGRLGRNAVASVCGTAKGCPGTIGTGPKFYDTFSFANTSAITECLKITLDQSSCSGALIAGAYLDSFDGTNLCTNYLGDEGASPAVGSFQVNVPAGHNLILSIQQVADGTFCTTGYRGTVTGFIDDTPDNVASVATSSLWPASHDLVNVGLSVTSTGTCQVNRQVSVFSDEDDVDPQTIGDMSPDAKNIALDTLRLRAERRDSGDGRVYLIVVTTTDGQDSAFSCSTVTVPANQSAAGKASVAAQAAAAKTFCTNNGGAAPPGFFIVGDGPVIGPKQ
jgi:hypothetical protein